MILQKLDRSGAGAASTPPSKPHQLPPEATAGTLYGRVKQCHELEAALRDRKSVAVLGPAGFGKTALAAKAVKGVVGTRPQDLAASPYPDGVLFLNLYAYRGQADAVWSAMADDLAGSDFRQLELPRSRATEACRGKQILVIIEGGEQADGIEGRSTLEELLSVLSPENRSLLLTREKKQTVAGATISVGEPLSDLNASQLFDKLTDNRFKTPHMKSIRERVLKLLNGHPLALTWAGGLLARHDENPNVLADEWEADPIRTLSDPTKSTHTLQWLFGRSVLGLDDAAKHALTAAGLLAPVLFPEQAIVAVALMMSKLAQPSHDPEKQRENPSDGQQDPATAARQAIKQLVDCGLLRRDSDRPEYCGFTHDLGYQFARNELSSDVGARLGLAIWLHYRLSAALKVGANSNDEIPDLLRHAAALLRTDFDQQLWDPLANFLLYEGRDRLNSLGRLDRVNAALGAVSDWFKKFPAEKLAESEWQRELSVSFNRLSDLATAQGNLPEAQRMFAEALRIAQRLADADPDNAQWQRDLSVSFNKLGDLATAQGNLPEAQRMFEEALRIRQRLADADPDNAQWQRDLVVSHQRLATLAQQQDDDAAFDAEMRECFLVLDRMRQRDMHLDPPITRLYQQLVAIFGDGNVE